MSTENLVKSPIRWWGGKYYYLKSILPYFPPTRNYLIYIEMFCGSALMFFNYKPIRAILNDKNDELVNFWNVIRDKKEPLERELEYRWLAPSWYAELGKRTDDVGRAAFFYMKNRSNFCAKDGSSFEYNYNNTKVIKDFTSWKVILDRCTSLAFWNLDFREVFARLNEKGKNSADFFIYEDPPYFDNAFYDDDFKLKDHEDLCKLNHGTEHHIILSYPDNEWVRKNYQDWFILELGSFHTPKMREKEDFNELLLSNKPFIIKRKEMPGTQVKVI